MQKTAYEMRISDWSSDVCSSDLPRGSGNAAGISRHGGRRPGATLRGHRLWFSRTERLRVLSVSVWNHTMRHRERDEGDEDYLREATQNPVKPGQAVRSLSNSRRVRGRLPPPDRKSVV